MKSNPDFFYCENKQALPGAGLVLYTKPPYWVGQVIKFKTHDDYLNSMKVSRHLAVGKILGYSIAVVHVGQLANAPIITTQEQANDLARIFREMANFFYNEKVIHSPYYRRYKSDE